MLIQAALSYNAPYFSIALLAEKSSLHDFEKLHQIKLNTFISTFDLQWVRIICIHFTVMNLIFAHLFAFPVQYLPVVPPQKAEPKYARQLPKVSAKFSNNQYSRNQCLNVNIWTSPSRQGSPTNCLFKCHSCLMILAGWHRNTNQRWAYRLTDCKSLLRKLLHKIRGHLVCVIWILCDAVANKSIINIFAGSETNQNCTHTFVHTPT